MTPVEAINTSCARQPAIPAADSAVSRTASVPALPVKALALPAFTTRTLAVPPASCLRHQSTGADGILDLVKTPATWVPGAITTMRRSLRSLYLMPLWPAASRTPASGGTVGKSLGAKGDLAEFDLTGPFADSFAAGALCLGPGFGTAALFLAGGLARCLCPPNVPMAIPGCYNPPLDCGGAD